MELENQNKINSHTTLVNGKMIYQMAKADQYPFQNYTSISDNLRRDSCMDMERFLYNRDNFNKSFMKEFLFTIFYQIGLYLNKISIILYLLMIILTQ